MTQSIRKSAPNQPLENADMFHALDVELWFAKRLEEQGYHVFLGTTTPDIRRERIREAILARGCDCVIVGRGPHGKPETYAQAFQRFYNQPLTAKLKGTSRVQTSL